MVRLLLPRTGGDGEVNMSQEDAMRARVAGRAATEARTVWCLTINDGLALRCLAQGDGFVVQARTKTWTDIATGYDAGELLSNVVSSKGSAGAIQRAVQRARGAR